MFEIFHLRNVYQRINEKKGKSKGKIKMEEERDRSPHGVSSR